MIIARFLDQLVGRVELLRYSIHRAMPWRPPQKLPSAAAHVRTC